MTELKKTENKENEPKPETMEDMLDYERTFIVFDDGDLVKGKVVRIDKDEVLVDIGYKSEGAIPINELCIRPNVKPEEVVSLGEEIEALVLQKEDKEGRLILSRKRAEHERAWRRIEAINEENGIVEGEVIEVVKGGLILDVGLRAFLPASLIEFQRVKELDQFLGQKLECKIIEMDRNRRNVVVSRRAILEGRRLEDRKEVLAKLQKGQILTGKVSSLADFGAFVDLGELDGLIHISELSWSKISHPSEVAAIGDEVKVQVLDIDEDRGRVSLGLRQTQEDPWREAVGKLKVGEVAGGTVERLAPFGAFVSLGDGLEGLVHLSELSEDHIASPDAVVKVGDKIKVKVVDVDLERRRVSLSLRQAEPAKAVKPKAEPQAEPAKAVKPKAEPKAEKTREKVKTEKEAVEKAAAEAVPAVEEEVAAEARVEEPLEAEPVLPEAEGPAEAAPAEVTLTAQPETALEEAAEIEPKLEPEQEIKEEEAAAEEEEVKPPRISVIKELKSSKEFEESKEKVVASKEEKGQEPSSLEEILADMKSSRSQKKKEQD